MIDIKNMTFHYAGSDGCIFDRFSLHLHPGKVYGLLGPNGAGKSTLLYIIMGLLRPQAGQVTANGTDVSLREATTLADMYLVPEEFELPRMTLREYVAMHRPFYPRFSEAILRQCLAEFRLPEDLHLARLSMGQRKKVIMAFALAAGTRCLLMDEPTNGLDIASKHQFRRVIASCMTDDRLILLSTHQLHDVETLLDHLLILGQEPPASPSPSAPSPSSSSPAAVSPSFVLCDATLSRLTEHLSFTLTPSPLPAALYAERTARGYASISRRRPDDEETPLNLELLYNAVNAGAPLLIP